MVNDILIDSGFDLAVVGGDLVVGQADGQHINLILQTGKGEWPEAVWLGVGLADGLLDEGELGELRGELSRQLSLDGGTLRRFENVEGQIKVVGDYL